jgi:hypothetical protein
MESGKIVSWRICKIVSWRSCEIGSWRCCEIGSRRSCKIGSYWFMEKLFIGEVERLVHSKVEIQYTDWSKMAEDTVSCAIE